MEEAEEGEGREGMKVKRWPKPTTEKPTMEQLNYWAYDSVCEATDGCRVEPDGVCQHGYPSWLMYLGFI